MTRVRSVKRLVLDRRAFLRGAGQAALALPFLEVMAERKAAAATPPLRYLVTFSGICTGTDGAGPDLVVPTTTGMTWAANLRKRDGVHALNPIEARGLGADVTVVSNLTINRATGPAHWNARWHAPTMRPLLSGKSSDGKFVMDSPTSDVMVASKVGAGSRFPHLAMRVQAKLYRGGETDPGLAVRGRMSADRNGAIEPFVNPRQIYEQLFGTGQASNGGQVAAGLKRDRAVVDLVLARAKRLRERLGVADQRRLDQHLDEVRGVEMRLAALEKNPVAACKPAAPVTKDFAVGANGQSGWSGEKERGDVITELVYLALACDLFRSGSLLYSYAQSDLSLTSLLGYSLRSDIHEVHHASGGPVDHARVWAWHVDFWATLIEKLKRAPEPNGSVLDNSLLVFTTEGGHGKHAGAMGLNDTFGSHSGLNMMVMMAGRAGGKFTPKGHLRAPQGAHPAQVLVSAMGTLGVEEPLGEIDAGVPGL